MTADRSGDNEIDDSLYSRQRFVLGETGMQLISKARVFICGLSGVGVEIAKNLTLAGVGEVIIQDGSICSYEDLGTQFYVRESDIDAGRTRAEASLPELAALNPYVKVSVDSNDLLSVRTPLDDPSNTDLFVSLIDEGSKLIDCLVLTHGSLHAASLLNVFCRKYSIPFVYTEVYGVTGHLFCDFGPEFLITDPDGETPKEFFIGTIEKVSPTELHVTVFAERRHHLDTGNVVRFQEVTGMTELNTREFPVRVLTPSSFAIAVDTDSLSPYEGGGFARQVIQPKTVAFQHLLDQLYRPSIVVSDLSCPNEGPVLHRLFLTLKKFELEEGRYPEPWNEDDWLTFSEKFRSLCSVMPDEVPDLDMELVRRLALTSAGQLIPLCAFFGGVAAQECMKAITGCFTPFHQWLYMHCDSVVPRSIPDGSASQLRRSRYSPLRICIGEERLRQLRELSVFMVGCGAIGCELLKNLALLGVATNDVPEECDFQSAASSPRESSTPSRAGYSEPINGDERHEQGGSNAPELSNAIDRDTPHSPHARIVVTDPDHIEKSNLNRQFLFHSEHIGQSKSSVAAKVVVQLNPAVSIEAMSEKFSPSTAKTIFTDRFFEHLLKSPSDVPRGVVLAALDSVPSRRYTDQRCVSLRIPLFESGTLGSKGHVQVVLPFLTESYNSQRDDDSGADGAQSIPYCTLKSFPSLPVHCIEWSREKFASSFTLKPSKLVQLISGFDAPDSAKQLVHVIQQLRSTQDLSDPRLDAKALWLCSQLNRSLARFIATRPIDWVGCVQLARDKFERYFNHKARQLLHSFPPNTRLPDGSLFWKLPRRQPCPVTFDSANPLHQQFIISYARLVGAQLGILPPDTLTSTADPGSLETHLEACFIDYVAPVFRPSSKRIVTDESEKQGDQKPEPRGDSGNKLDEHLLQALDVLESAIKDSRKRTVLCQCQSVPFEKDDDRLAHVDFVAAAANLRATMYGLSTTPRHEVRRIAGHIVPAIATTTAAVAGLVCVELVKHVCGSDACRNAFLNLALPLVVLSEPGVCVKTRLPNGTEFTLWDRMVLEIPFDSESYRLRDLLRDIKSRHDLEACVINQGNRMVYVSYLPVHASRLDKPLKNFLLLEPGDRHVDLLVAYSPGADVAADADYIQGPPLRLILS